MKTQMSSKTTRFIKTPSAIAVIIALAFTGCSSTQSSAKKKVLWPNKEEAVVEKKTQKVGIEVPEANKQVVAEKDALGKIETGKVLMPVDRKLVMKDFTLTYIVQEEADGDIDHLTLQHPLSINERQMVFHMVALSYKNYSLPGKAGPVFTKEDIKKTKRLLTKALNKAHPQNIIGFEVESKAGATQGQLFASGGVLHWRFFKIRGVWFSKTRNSVEQYGTWKMVPRNGQRIHKSNQPRGTRQWTNWIEAKINLPAPANLKISRPKIKRRNPGTAQAAPSPSQPNRPKTTAPEKNAADLEEKLKFLKHLHENQLIDKREYEQKRKDLLNQYL
jgi:hypothetical protein